MGFALHENALLTLFFIKLVPHGLCCIILLYVFPHFLTPYPKKSATSGEKTYVKGFAFDLQKLQSLVGATDDSDPRIYALVNMIMRDLVDRDSHWLCGGRRLDDETDVEVISLGEGSVSKDLEGLKKKEIPTPRYLTKMSSALTGPDVFEFVEW